MLSFQCETKSKGSISSFINNSYKLKHLAWRFVSLVLSNEANTTWREELWFGFHHRGYIHLAACQNESGGFQRNHDFFLLVFSVDSTKRSGISDRLTFDMEMYLMTYHLWNARTVILVEPEMWTGQRVENWLQNVQPSNHNITIKSFKEESNCNQIAFRKITHTFRQLIPLFIGNHLQRYRM